MVDEVEKQGEILIIDSISHFWKDLMESYLKKTEKKRLAFHDWNVLKPMWQEFSDRFLNSRLHIIMCGRAGYEWDYFDDDGKMELIKVGTKMKVETEFGYEPSLLIEMERSKNKESKAIEHIAYIIKDRSSLLDGKTFVNPTFENFLPFFKFLNLGGEHKGIEEKDSQDLFEDETGRPDWKIEREQKQITLEEIEGEMVKTFPGQSTKEKAIKVRILEAIWGTKSWTKIQSLSLGELREGLAILKLLLIRHKEFVDQENMTETEKMIRYIVDELKEINAREEDVPDFVEDVKDDKQKKLI